MARPLRHGLWPCHLSQRERQGRTASPIGSKNKTLSALLKTVERPTSRTWHPAVSRTTPLAPPLGELATPQALTERASRLKAKRRTFRLCQSLSLSKDFPRPGEDVAVRRQKGEQVARRSRDGEGLLPGRAAQKSPSFHNFHFLFFRQKWFFFFVQLRRIFCPAGNFLPVLVC